MALSRVTVWSSGQVLTASALNGEYNNILDNALSLISPLTGTLAVGGNDITGIDEIAFDNAGADATAAGRLRRNATNLTWHNGTAASNLLTALTGTAIGTATGTTGRMTSPTAIGYGAQGGYLYGLTLSNNGVDATNDIDIAIGEAASDDTTYATRVVMSLTSALTKQLDVNWVVGTNQGMLDTGAIANGTYHIFAIMRPDTSVVDILASTSATAPTMPTNYTKKRRIGSILREGAAIVLFDQAGDEFWRDTPILDVDSANPGTAAVTRTLSVPLGVVVQAIMNVGVVPSANDFSLYLSALASTDLAPSRTVAPLGAVATVAGGGATNTQGSTRVWTNASAQIRSRISASGAGDTIRIATLGWLDRRGRDA